MKTLIDRWISSFLRAEPPRDFSDTQPDAPVDALRTLCFALVEDVAPSHRQRIETLALAARRSADFWNLRAALFGTIALSFGERIARERIAQLDARLD